MMHRTKAGKLKFHRRKDCSQKITMTAWKQGSFSICCHFCLRRSPAATSDRHTSPTSLVLYDQPHVDVLDALKNLKEQWVSMFRQLNCILPGKRLGFRRSSGADSSVGATYALEEHITLPQGFKA